MGLGWQSCWVTTPSGEICRSVACCTVDCGRTNQWPAWTISASSSCRNSLWSSAELWAPYCMASSWAAILHGGVLSTTGIPCLRSFSRKGPAGCGRLLVSAKHCCPQHFHANQTKSPLWSLYKKILAVLANLPRRSKCCCVAHAFFSAVPAGSFISALVHFVGAVASSDIPLPWI